MVLPHQNLCLFKFKLLFKCYSWTRAEFKKQPDDDIYLVHMHFYWRNRQWSHYINLFFFLCYCSCIALDVRFMFVSSCCCLYREQNMTQFLFLSSHSAFQELLIPSGLSKTYQSISHPKHMNPCNVTRTEPFFWLNSSLFIVLYGYKSSRAVTMGRHGIWACSTMTW